eukprot:755298-Rhodomonas_salina.1
MRLFALAPPRHLVRPFTGSRPFALETLHSAKRRAFTLSPSPVASERCRSVAVMPRQYFNLGAFARVVKIRVKVAASRWWHSS